MVSKIGSSVTEDGSSVTEQGAIPPDILWDLVDHSPAGTFVLNSKGYIYANQALARITGYTVGDILSELRPLDLIYPDDRPKAAEIIKKGMKDHRDPLRLTVRLLHRDGTPVPATVLGRGVELRGENTILGTVIGPMECMEVEERLKESEARARAILNAVPDLMFRLSSDGVFLDYNAPRHGDLALPPDKFLGRNICDVLPASLSDLTVNHIKKALETGEIQVYEYQLKVMGGDIRDFEARMVPVGDGSVLAMIRDITERKRAEREILRYKEHLEELVEERTSELESFVFSVSHDLREPLRAMQGLSQALMEDYAGQMDEKAEDYINRINRAAERMDSMIQDLLQYSRVTRSEMSLAPVELESVINRALEDSKTHLGTRKAEVVVKGGMPCVWANESALILAVSNLISNAVKFVPSDRRPRVEVWGEEGDSVVRLYVRDNGIGIPKEYHDRIFQMFERLHGMEEYPGTGMGLAIVSKAVARMGGKVGMESTVGKGSTFWIELKSCNAPKENVTLGGDVGDGRGVVRSGY